MMLVNDIPKHVWSFTDRFRLHPGDFQDGGKKAYKNFMFYRKVSVGADGSDEEDEQKENGAAEPDDIDVIVDDDEQGKVSG